MPTLEDYKDFFAGLRKRTGIDALEPDDAGLVSVRVQDEYNLNFQFVSPAGKILCFIEVADLPKDAGREVYRELLAAGLFGLETAGGHFTLAAETETVVYDYLFDFAPAADVPEAFVGAVEKIVQLCDVWAERIRGILAGGKTPAADVPDAGPALRLNP